MCCGRMTTYYPFWSYGAFYSCLYYGGYAPAYDYSYRDGYGAGGLSDIYGGRQEVRSPPRQRSGRRQRSPNRSNPC